MRHQPPRKWILITLATLFVVQVILVAVSIGVLLMIGRSSSLLIAVMWAVTVAVLFVRERRVYIEAQRTCPAPAEEEPPRSRPPA